MADQIDECFLKKIFFQPDHFQAICSHFTISELLRCIPGLSRFHRDFINDCNQQKLIETCIAYQFDDLLDILNINIKYENDNNNTNNSDKKKKYETRTGPTTVRKNTKIHSVCFQIACVLSSFDYFESLICNSQNIDIPDAITKSNPNYVLYLNNMQPQRYNVSNGQGTFIGNAIQFDDILMTVGISACVEYWLPKLFSNVFGSKIHSRLLLKFYGLEYNDLIRQFNSEYLKYSQWYFDINRCVRYDASTIFIQALKSKGFELVKKLLLSADIYQWDNIQFKKFFKWILSELIFGQNTRLAAINRTKRSYLPKHLQSVIKNFDNVNSVRSRTNNGSCNKINTDNCNNSNGVLLEIPFSFFLCLFRCLSCDEKYRIPNTRRTHDWFSDLTKIEWLIDCMLESPFIEYIYVKNVYTQTSESVVEIERIQVLYQLLWRETQYFDEEVIEALANCIEDEDDEYHDSYAKQFCGLVKKIHALLRNCPSKISKKSLKENGIFYDKDQATYTYELNRKELDPEKELVRQIIYKCVTSD